MIDVENMKEKENEKKLSKFKSKLFSTIKKSEMNSKSPQTKDRTSSSSSLDPLMAES